VYMWVCQVLTFLVCCYVFVCVSVCVVSSCDEGCTDLSISLCGGCGSDFVIVTYVKDKKEMPMMMVMMVMMMMSKTSLYG
jgi:hypothetical protein